MNSEATPGEVHDQWADDLLARKPSSAFLERTVSAQMLNPQQSQALCVAIDGDWGTGKSFFIERWRLNLQSRGRCVVHFDAWKNDLSDDPLIGFISEIRTALKPWLDRLPDEKLGNKMVSRATLFAKNAGRAVKPLLKAAAKHALAKAISEEASNIVQGVINGDEEDDHDVKVEFSSQAIEKYFEAALEGHRKQQDSIAHLISELERISEEIETLGSARPIYVFIDELDRCRPSYALRLLEGMKHIFNAKGICFILATNISQLSHSVKAVYGEGFDGRGYLRRFIDYDYRLAAPNNFAYANHLLKNSMLSKRAAVYTGMTDSSVSGQNSTGDMLARVSNMFGLDLRTMRQVLGKAEAAAASIPEKHYVHVLYLFSLAAISTKRPDVLDQLCETQPATIPALEHMLKDRGQSFTENDWNGKHHVTTNISLADLLELYQSAVHLGSRKFNEAYANEQSPAKAAIFGAIMANNISNNRPSVHLYPYLIREAAEMNFN